MILSCPTCATRYFVAEDKLGPEGRKVRCTACGESWMAEAKFEPYELEPEPVVFDRAPVDDAGLDIEAVERPRNADAVSRAYREKVEAQRRTREAMTVGVVWASLAAGFVLFLVCAVLFRVQVVRLWPRTAGAYAAVRLPVNPLGLAPEDVQAQPGLQDGQAALVVTGVERNVEAKPRPVAPLRISVYDRSGARLASGIVHPGAGDIAPGEARPFSISFLNPPMAGAQVGVDFVFERPAPKPPAPAAVQLNLLRQAGDEASDPAPHLRGLAGGLRLPHRRAKLARPVAPGSPYALPKAAQAQSRRARDG